MDNKTMVALMQQAEDVAKLRAEFAELRAAVERLIKMFTPQPMPYSVGSVLEADEWERKLMEAGMEPVAYTYGPRMDPEAARGVSIKELEEELKKAIKAKPIRRDGLGVPPGTVSYKTTWAPWPLLVAGEDAPPAVERPWFCHDCDRDIFLGRYFGPMYGDCDLYYSHRDDPLETVIVRFGNTPNHYASGACEEHQLNAELAEAQRRAEERGIVIKCTEKATPVE